MTIARCCQGSGIQAKDDGREGDFPNLAGCSIGSSEFRFASAQRALSDAAYR
jgi:hypothetical protein